MIKTVQVKGTIIPNNDQWIYDLLEMDATCPKKVRKQLADMKPEDEVVVEISSGGGSLFAGVEIYTELKKIAPRVEIVGIAGSAASIIAMAGKTVAITPAGQIMIHRAACQNAGNCNDMDDAAKALRSMDEGIALAYKQKCGLDTKELLELMDNETWLSAEKAKELDLVDEIMFEQENDPVKAVAAAETLPISAKAISALENMKMELAMAQKEVAKLKAKIAHAEFVAKLKEEL